MSYNFWATYKVLLFCYLALWFIFLLQVIMAMEDEFGFEIPDEHGERLLTAGQIIQYVADHEDIYH